MSHNNQPDTTATIEDKNGRYYRLRLSDGQELTVPVHEVSRQAKIGDTLYLRFLTESEIKIEKTELARSLLEEILNGQ